jgi:hypothetical protein
MRRVIVGAMVSMDGVMQAPGGPEEDPTSGFKLGGWVAPFADTDPVFGEEVGKLFGEPFELLQLDGCLRRLQAKSKRKVYARRKWERRVASETGEFGAFEGAHQTLGRLEDHLQGLARTKD